MFWNLVLAKQPLCERLELDSLWSSLGECLSELSRNSDQNAVLILQPAVEAFFLVHAGKQLGARFLISNYEVLHLCSVIGFETFKKDTNCSLKGWAWNALKLRYRINRHCFICILKIMCMRLWAMKMVIRQAKVESIKFVTDGVLCHLGREVGLLLSQTFHFQLQASLTTDDFKFIPIVEM